MKITTLAVECDHEPRIKVWAECYSREDIEDIIAWLNLASDLMAGWKEIKEKRHAKIPHAPETAASKDEDHESREV